MGSKAKLGFAKWEGGLSAKTTGKSEPFLSILFFF